MIDKENNREAIYQFVKYWRNNGGAEVNSVGNAYLECLVSYSSNRGDDTFRTKLTIISNGYHDGKISLEELKGYPAEEYHLDFSADLQNIQFNVKENTLIIKGESKKMGKYQVYLDPIM